MLKPASDYSEAQRHLARRDRILKRLIADIGHCTLRQEPNRFASLARSIISQQISTKAALAIRTRLEAVSTGGRLTADGILSLSDEGLRAAGLSAAKAKYLRDLAQHVSSGTVRLQTIHKLSDEEVIAALTPIRGIGRWTAQMFLMFRLGRPDVLPDLDLGVQKGIQRTYRLRKLPTPDKVKKIGAKWAPYRTVASWYMWRLLDAPTPVPRSAGNG